MSLLNDALRAAEQRHGRPGAPAAYTGQATAAHTGQQRGVWLLIVVVLVIVVLAGWWWLSGQTSAGEGTIGPVTVQPSPEPEAAPEPEPVKAVEPVDVIAVAPEASTPESEPAVEAVQPVPEPVAVATTPVANQESVKASADAQADASSAEPEAAAADVKQVRDTPEVVDRRTSRELERLLGAGRWAEARQTLDALTAEQDAPLSRHVVAKRLLVEGEADQALALLPATVAQTSAPLRLLRARALLADNDLASAVATLQARVPEIADNAEYHVTLATLLHQSGNNEEAARRWAALIAWDDSRAPWWVGLAIALESDGQRETARRAYEQAAALPGLPPSLAEYVRQRLQSLRAG
ncbi:MAG: tetratricopeptide repeat protein [Pseudomonadota bacterium]